MSPKVKYEQISQDIGASFRYEWSVRDYKKEIPLHFHPELEVTYIHRGSGYRMVGDFLEPFFEGEVLFFPANVPHCWIYDPESCPPDGNRECLFVQFLPSVLEKGVSFFGEWELFARYLLSRQQSLKLEGESAEKVKVIMKAMTEQQPNRRLLSLIEILLIIAVDKEYTPVGISDRTFSKITKHMERLQVIFKYVIENYKEKITLAGVAGEVKMTETAFCAFFKREIGKSFTTYLNEYRIQMACNLLRNYPAYKISAIAWQCGFMDMPYFNRCFKKMKGVSPAGWRSNSQEMTE
ncbi:AraC family transcriptional regulator [Pedobacter sp. AW31-3R]|uniref:AraC family transcriptional regulator n=1 Tax=Pedobacter sp. AW31-3R TaxID=3445781 RepID=UPI003F9FDC65